mmetsp:Transcript_266/g.866  ORF Transcript_266/g.866 Transcript_266/m.866 type:complete len:225 (-) Transcript_266:185-859(-)
MLSKKLYPERFTHSFVTYRVAVNPAHTACIGVAPRSAVTVVAAAHFACSEYGLRRTVKFTVMFAPIQSGCSLSRVNERSGRGSSAPKMSAAVIIGSLASPLPTSDDDSFDVFAFTSWPFPTDDCFDVSAFTSWPLPTEDSYTKSFSTNPSNCSSLSIVSRHAAASAGATSASTTLPSGSTSLRSAADTTSNSSFIQPDGVSVFVLLRKCAVPTSAVNDDPTSAS